MAPFSWFTDARIDAHLGGTKITIGTKYLTLGIKISDEH